MLQLLNVCKSHPINHGKNDRMIFKDVNMTVQRGEKYGILGRNGAGKSTLIHIVSGFYRPDSGQVVKNMSISWPLAFGGAFQGSLTGRDNVKLIARVYNVDIPKTIALVEDFAELGTYLDEPVKSYSSGMSSRLAFAISMAIDFDCFLIDEGMSVGDYRFHKKCDDELFGKRGDRAMIIVSHQTNIIREHCTHAAVLEAGTLTIYDQVDDAIAAYEAL